MRNLFKLDIKTYMLCLLIILAIIGTFQQHVSVILPQILIAVLTATSLDILINLKKSRRVIFPSSAFITGMIIALVLSSGISWFIPMTASVIAIIQKHIIRYKGRHIFNPANSGLLFVILFYRTYLTWWGQSFWPLIVLIGIFICYKMRRIKLPVIFVIVFTLLSALNSLLTRQPLLDSLLLINIFFVFIMLIEPKTIPVTKKGIIAYAALAALFSFVSFKLIPQYDFSIFALALTNASVPFLDSKRKLYSYRRTSLDSSPTTTVS